MATLRVTATPSEGLRRYVLLVDGMTVPMRSDDKGAVAVNGTCGDGSRHLLNYTLVGSTGATLSVVVTCDDRPVCEVSDIEIFPGGEPYAADVTDFRL